MTAPHPVPAFKDALVDTPHMCEQLRERIQRFPKEPIGKPFRMPGSRHPHKEPIA